MHWYMVLTTKSDWVPVLGCSNQQLKPKTYPWDEDEVSGHCSTGSLHESESMVSHWNTSFIHTQTIASWPNVAITVACRTCQYGDIRFRYQGDLPSRCYYSGKVEVCLSGNWSTVCIDSWSSIDAGVACTQLGHSRNGKHCMINLNEDYNVCILFVSPHRFYSAVIP